MTPPEDKVALNFLEIVTQPFPISVYVKKVLNPDQPPPYPNVKRYNLPKNLVKFNTEFIPYYISESAQTGFEPVTISSEVNKVLTVHTLFESLVRKSKKALREGTDFTVEDGFRKKVNFIISSSDLGNEEIWMEPYHLNVSQEFGFLIEPLAK